MKTTQQGRELIAEIALILKDLTPEEKQRARDIIAGMCIGVEVSNKKAG